MKILLVDNSTLHLQEIKDSLRGHEVEIVRYTPLAKLIDADKDLVILSGGGGEGQEIDDLHTEDELWYDNQIKFVLKTKKPIIGICMGFEVIATAFGSKVEKVNGFFEDFQPVKMLQAGINMFGMNDIKQYEAHHMGVKTLSHPLAALAYSPTGIEIFKHKTRPIIATQFHPEVPGGSLNLASLKEVLNLN